MRAIGIVSFVDLGCAVWSTERRRATSVDEVPLGGVVVAVTEELDQETGEVDRAFLCFDHETTRPRLAWSTLRESEVDRDTIEALDARKIGKAARRLAEDIVFTRPHTHRTGVITTDELRAARAIIALYEVVFGPGGELHAVLEPKRFSPSAPTEVVPVNVAALVD